MAAKSFDRFMKNFNKQYPDSLEQDKRKKAYIKNYMNMPNGGSAGTATVKLNALADKFD